MKANDIRKTLKANGVRVWQLMQSLGVSRSKYYRLSHNNFSGCEDEIKNGMNKLINEKDVVKNDD